MANKKDVLKIFCFSLPQLSTEWLSILGDKYGQALTFEVELTDSFQEAQVIAWDGLVNKKMELFLPEITSLLKDKILLLMGESSTHLKDLPLTKAMSIEARGVVELPGWTLLPEHILSSLDICFKKLKNV